MSAPHNAVETGRSHGTPATSTALVLTVLSLLAGLVHGASSGDWTPLGVAAVTSWAVFLPALVYDAARAERGAR